MVTNESPALDPAIVAGASPIRLMLGRAGGGLRIGELWLQRVIEALVAAALLTQVAVLFLNVVGRRFFHYYAPWTLEVAQLTLLVQAFIGAPVAYARSQHITVVAGVMRLGERWRERAGVLADWVVLGLSVWVCKLAYPLVGQGWAQKTPILEIPETSFALPIVVGMGLVAVYAVERLFRPEIWRTSLAIGLLLAAIVGAGIGARSLTGTLNPATDALYLMLAVCALLISLSVPLAFALSGASLIHLYASQTAPLVAVPLNMQQGINSFVLLAIPLFIAAGLLMTYGGLSEPLVACLAAFLARLRGGLNHVIVVAMFVFSGLSGSKLADVAGVGVPMRDGLRVRGHDPSESAGLIAASAAAGETIPPSLAILVLGSVTTLSIKQLFVAGVLPAVLISALLMVAVAFRAKRGDAPPRTTLVGKFVLLLKAVPSLTVPVLLIGGIVSGLATPTEVGSVAVVYAFLLSGLVYRRLTLGRLTSVLAETGATSGMVLFLVSGASTFSWSLIVGNVPQSLQNAVTALGSNRYIFLIVSIVALIIVGSILEGLAGILIFGPLFVPLAVEKGVDPTQYGIVFLLAMGIGVFLPPLGIGLFTSAAVFGTTMERAAKPALKYLAVVVAGVILVAFVPWLTSGL